jgi:hypothetical protein
MKMITFNSEYAMEIPSYNNSVCINERPLQNAIKLVISTNVEKSHNEKSTIKGIFRQAQDDNAGWTKHFAKVSMSFTRWR